MDIYVNMLCHKYVGSMDFHGTETPIFFRSPQPHGPHVPENSCLTGNNPSSSVWSSRRALVILFCWNSDH